ncbi:MAG TPA: DivIVA domain-containing protein [Fimbriimonadaceae bacterium]|nr:DivIVA domain-containing protein [Fimbriimonadaceae bacterium]
MYRGEAMERMMPMDLERAQLKSVFRGYDRSQVQALLQRAAKEMSALRSEIDTLRSDISRSKSEAESYRAQEDTLKEALLLAQKTADETRANAHKEADLILESSRQKAAESEADMQAKINDLRWELERLRLEKQRFLAGYRSMLESQLRDIGEMGGFAVVEGDVSSEANQA